jgi:hypothetical protein
MRREVDGVPLTTRMEYRDWHVVGLSWLEILVVLKGTAKVNALVLFCVQNTGQSGYM